jgi:hypothetical protein
MPIDIDGQGWNEETTRLKQEWFSKFALYHLNLKHHEVRKFTRSVSYSSVYHFIDATAGTGYLPGIGNTSPVRHAIAAKRHREKCDKPLRVKAHLIESNFEAAFALEKTLILEQRLMLQQPVYDSEIYEGQYQKIIQEEFFGHRRGKAKIPFYGLLYCDPNGQSPEFELLRKLNYYHPRMDVLLHVSAGNIKRVRMQRGGLSLAECMKYVGKRQWKIARVGETSHQWAFLFGTNIPDMQDRKRLGLYRLETEEGQQILQELNYTERECARLTKEGSLPLCA